MKSLGTSRIEGFHRLSISERVAIIGQRLSGSGRGMEGGALAKTADRMIENAVGVMGVPLGIATNFIVNGFEMLVPMAIEEPSVVAGASKAAKIARAGGGFTADVDPPLMIAQVEILDPAPDGADRLRAACAEIKAAADAVQPELVSLGGGTREVVVREAVGRAERLVVHLVVDCVDAMGANSVNTMAEAVSEHIAALAGGRFGLRILSNLADRRVARACCAIPCDALAHPGTSGDAVARGIAAAAEFAAADPYRAATHNKGIFNGIDAILLATGNDWRAVEAGGHAYAARGGRYAPLSQWKTEEDVLSGTLEMPLAVGTVGGASRAHPVARSCIELLGVESARELAGVVAAVGLASNLAALAALASEGIQRGHMRLHLRKEVSRD